MKQRILLFFVMTSFITLLHAQKKDQKLTGYAITAAEKGGRSWNEVRLVDINTGEEVKTIYQSKQDIEALNARTGKPVVKKEINPMGTTGTVTVRKIVNLDQELNSSNTGATVRRVMIMNQMPAVQSDKPFATNSAAIAYDKKHERLYFTPMGINQLRYIDLKAKNPTLYYFEDEAFGNVKGMGDAPNQITRMVFASDGDGYALTNDGNHLIQFTTAKKQTITDLGPLTDDAANGNFSVHSSRGYGGDMIADASGNLYLITANRNVFKININSKLAQYQGTIKGLPQGFSTNGAMVEEGSKVIIASSESTVGYYRFDLITLQAEKASASSNVFNASDLANGNLAFDKKKKDRKNEEAKDEAKPTVPDVASKQVPVETVVNDGILAYPNPVTNGVVKLSFSDLPAGKYQVQFLDMGGKLVSANEVNINNKIQVEEFRLPELIGKGTYFVKVFSEINKVNSVTKLIVQ